MKKEGNTEEKVHLIGVNTPESVHPDETKNSESGKAAREYTKELLANHTDVWLQQDVSETDTRNVEEVKNKMLNGILLRDKIAEPMAIEPDVSYDVSYKEMFDTIYYTDLETFAMY